MLKASNVTFFPPKFISFSPASLLFFNKETLIIVSSIPAQRFHSFQRWLKKFQRQGRLKYRIKRRPLCLDGMNTRTISQLAKKRKTLVGKRTPSVAHSLALRSAMRRGGGPTGPTKRWRRECEWVQEACSQKRYFDSSFPSYFLRFHTPQCRNC